LKQKKQVEPKNLNPKNPQKFKTTLDNFGRVCTKCLEYKTWDNYFVSKKSHTGHQAECKKCKHERKKVNRNYDRERYCAKKQKQKLKQEKPILAKARELRSRLLGRSKDPGIKQTTPTALELEKWLTRARYICFYSGVELELNKITVDHKIPISRGGTNCLENLCIASHHMNTAKGGMTDEEFMDLLLLIRKWSDKGEGVLRRLKQGWF
jgi:5-methylcytosine-specific restriction endonuclease McrA